MRAAPDPAANFWNTTDVAAYLGVQVPTVSAYRQRGFMPPPDLTIGKRSHLWCPATVIEWAARRSPGQVEAGVGRRAAARNTRLAAAAVACPNGCEGALQPGTETVLKYARRMFVATCTTCGFQRYT